MAAFPSSMVAVVLNREVAHDLLHVRPDVGVRRVAGDLLDVDIALVLGHGLLQPKLGRVGALVESIGGGSIVRHAYTSLSAIYVNWTSWRESGSRRRRPTW